MSEIQYIKFHEVFDFYSSRAFVEAFKYLENSSQAIIPIEIKSPGGMVYALAEILDIIDSCKKPVATFVTSIAASCGAALAMAGTDGYRFIGPNARFMIHQAAGMSWGKASDVDSDAKLLNSMTEQFVYDRCDLACKKEKGYTKNLIKENFNADLFLTAKEAVDHGFFDKVATIGDIKNLDLIIKG